MFRTDAAKQSEQTVHFKYFFCVSRLIILEITEQRELVHIQCNSVCAASNIFHIFSYLNPVIHLLLAAVKMFFLQLMIRRVYLQHVIISNKDKASLL
jgi:hypothetical protein